MPAVIPRGRSWGDAMSPSPLHEAADRLIAAVDELRHTLVTAQQPFEIGLLTRDQVCALVACEKDAFYKHIAPHLERVEAGGLVRYTRSSYADWVARSIQRPPEEPAGPLAKQAMRRRNAQLGVKDTPLAQLKEATP